MLPAKWANNVGWNRDHIERLHERCWSFHVPWVTFTHPHSAAYIVRNDSNCHIKILTPFFITFASERRPYHHPIQSLEKPLKETVGCWGWWCSSIRSALFFRCSSFFPFLFPALGKYINQAYGHLVFPFRLTTSGLAYFSFRNAHVHTITVSCFRIELKL